MRKVLIFIAKLLGIFTAVVAVLATLTLPSILQTQRKQKERDTLMQDLGITAIHCGSVHDDITTMKILKQSGTTGCTIAYAPKK